MSKSEIRIREKNKIAFLIVIVIILCVLSNSIYFLVNQSDKKHIVLIILSCIVMVSNAMGYKLLKSSNNFRRVCLNSLSVTYLVTMFVSYDTQPYIYAIAFSMFIVALFYEDKIYMIGGLIIGFFVNLGCAIYQISNYHDSSTTLQYIFQCLLVLIIGASVNIYAKLQKKHSDEDAQEIQQKVKVNQMITQEVMQGVANLSDKFTQAKEQSSSLTNSMESNHFAVNNIAESTTSTAESIQVQTSMTYDIQKSIKEAAETTKSMQDTSSTANNIVMEGVEIIEDLKEQAKSVTKNSEFTKEKTKQLNESIVDVEQITASISNISSQTNLLALNASIEAARAGDAGRGFAVVADEIRNLSEETSNATNKITEIISQLTMDATEANNSMEQSIEAVSKQNELITKTGEKFSTIKQEINTLADAIHIFGGVMDNILEVNMNFSDHITQLAATTEEVSASSAEGLSISNTAMGNLRELNKLLEEIYSIANKMEESVRISE
ncbi:methyl-accepting chemotaxis protein [Anaerosporobacter faecicola]|uniref:methyl-accepting chemotaxis protein n=1 Tax=Anaerosporobacter faecicola TaxID=2718714 RepID=UPI0014391426|nr:methyl-accepting chemotaxis protein [Anaerosporobacter faecicola]